MAPMWHRPPIHRTAEVHALRRCGAAATCVGTGVITAHCIVLTREVRSALLFQCLVKICRPRCQNAHRAGSLTCPAFFRHPTGRTSRLLSCLARSVVCAPQILHCPSPNCDQTKTNSSISAADSVQVHCSRYADSMGVRTGVMRRPVDGRCDAGAAATAPVVRRTGAGRRQPDRSQSDVVMSGVVDSGPGGRHGNIDPMTHRVCLAIFRMFPKSSARRHESAASRC
jgi:hypothetical protein